MTASAAFAAMIQAIKDKDEAAYQAARKARMEALARECEG